MGAESPKVASAPTGAVFLSYASQDAEAAQKICDALRAAGIEVWLDKSELRGGDAWDRKIRDQIRHCALFIPIISAHSQARLEGYFRREWKFAVERKQDIADELAFLLPVVIDETPERGALVPEGFHEVQWTRLPAGAASPQFIQHVFLLLTGHEDSSRQSVQASRPIPASALDQPVAGSRSGPQSRMWLLLSAVAIAVIVGYIGIDRYVLHKGAAPPAASSGSVNMAPAAFSPPPHSIAVLPFVNLSGDKEQEYFSDGLTEELLNSLAAINELQVAARTSSFSFKEHPDIVTVAHRLNVATVLEGSVRRSAHTVRVTAQLINAVTGFHLWSKTYDRDLGDVLALQTEIANAVASALKVTLLSDLASKIEVGGTRSPAAFDAYLKGSQAYRMHHDAKDLKTAIAAYTEALQLDPTYAQAYVGRSRAFDELGSWWVATEADTRELYVRAQADAHKAIALAPDLGEGHLVLANSLSEQLDFTRASEEYERARALAPGSALVLRDYGLFAVLMGHTEQGLSAVRRAVLLDPLNRATQLTLVDALSSAGKQEQAVSVIQDALALDPTYFAYQWEPYYLLPNYQIARTMCESNPQVPDTSMCLAVVYEKLGQHADAEGALEKFKTASPDDWFHFAEIYAQWGDIPRALGSLETALRTRHEGLEYLKTDPILDPLRKEPRFQAIERELKFPD